MAAEVNCMRYITLPGCHSLPYDCICAGDGGPAFTARVVPFFDERTLPRVFELEDGLAERWLENSEFSLESERIQSLRRASDTPGYGRRQALSGGRPHLYTTLATLQRPTLGRQHRVASYRRYESALNAIDAEVKIVAIVEAIAGTSGIVSYARVTDVNPQTRETRAFAAASADSLPGTVVPLRMLESGGDEPGQVALELEYVYRPLPERFLEESAWREARRALEEDLRGARDEPGANEGLRSFLIEDRVAVLAYVRTVLRERELDAA
jgi:hypothetical protein